MIGLIMFTLLIVFSLLSVYILIRNNFVYEFVTSLNETCYQVCLNHSTKICDCNNLEDFMKEHERLEDMWKSISKIKYEKMLYSFTLINQNDAMGIGNSTYLVSNKWLKSLEEK